MKTSFLPRTLLLVGAVCASGFTAALADDSTDTSSPPPAEGAGAHHGHHGGGPLTPDEWAQMKKDRDAAFASDPSLKTEEEALHQQMKDHQDKVDAAILKQDPTAAPLIAKLKAGHHHGPPPPDDNGGAPPAQ